MNNELKKIGLVGLMVIMPNFVFAAGVKDLITSGYSLITSVLIPLAFALCLLYFFWGVFKYIWSGAGNDKALEEGKSIMVWGIVGLFVASSVWGIIAFIRSEINLPPTQNIKRPN